MRCGPGRSAPGGATGRWHPVAAPGGDARGSRPPQPAGPRPARRCARGEFDWL